MLHQCSCCSCYNQHSHWLEACYCGWKLVIHSSYADSFFLAGSLFFRFGCKPGYIVLQAIRHAIFRSTFSGSVDNYRICSSQLLHRSRLLGLRGGEGKPKSLHQRHKLGFISNGSGKNAVLCVELYVDSIAPPSAPSALKPVIPDAHPANKQ